MTAPRPGDVVGHYRIDGTIGVGGMGVVHAATDLRLGRRVALKVVLGHAAASPAFVARFQREAAVLARLDSPHVVAVYDHGEHDGQPWLAMQYAAGGDLRSLLERRGPMPPPLAARVAAQVADALVATHAVGVVHRDVKPANVLVRDDRVDRIHVYLSDFGVALTELAGTGLTTPGAIAGTWAYLAPERTRGAPGSPASDVYAVGCLLHELLTGRAPYSGSDVEVAIQHQSVPVPQLPGDDPVTRHLDRVLARAMAKDPAHRHPSAASLRDDLRVVAAGTLTGATPLPGPAAGPSRRRRGLLVGAAVGVAAVVATATGIAVATSGDPEPAPGPGPTASPTVPGPDDPTTTAPPDPPADPAYVTGDLDGDGLGDVAWADYERTVVVGSTGRGFGEAVRRPVTGREVVVGDLDADGTGDLVEIEGDGSLVVTVHPGGGRRLPPTGVDAPRSTGGLDPDYVAADVDGDGDDDLVVATARGTSETVVTVLLSRGDGTFVRPRRWYEGPLDPRQAGWAVGDLDGDGVEDLLHHAAVDQGYRVRRAEVLVSGGSAARGFEVTGPPLRVPEEIDGSYFGLERLDLGDVDGDGEPEVVGLDPYGFRAIVWEWLGDGFDSGRFWADPEIAGEAATGGGDLEATLADVDGDGLADVVTLGQRGPHVHLSTGRSFGFARRWRASERPSDDAVLVDRVSLGIY